MKTRRSVRNQNILWSAIKSESAPEKPIPVLKKNCFNCFYYPKQGRWRATCKLTNTKVLGELQKECFKSRTTTP